MRTQKKRKNTSFRLQRELCSFPFSPLSISVSFSLSLSPFLLHLWPLPPRRVNEEPAGSPQTEKFPKCFPIIAFCLSFTSCPFFLLLFFIFGSRFSQAARRLCPSFVPFLIFFLIFWHECLEVCISTMTASYMSPSSSSPPSPLSEQTPKHTLYPPLFTHVHKHISYLTSTRCLKIQTPLNFCQCLHVSSVSSNVNAL